MVLALALLAGAGLRWHWYRTTRPDYRMQRAREAMAEGEWARSAAFADDFEAAGHTDLAHLLRGESLFRQGYHADALAEFNRIQDTGAIRLEAAALSGRCLLQLGSVREAHRAFNFVLSQQPDHIDSWRGLAAIASDQGNLDQAVRHLLKVAELDRKHGRPHRLIGLIYKDLSQFAKAADAYTEALARDLPATVRRQVLQERAACQAQRREYAAAIASLDERQPGVEEPAALALRAECLWGLGRSRETRALLDRALRAHPQHASLLAFRGQVHLTEGEVIPAARSLEQALRADPHNPRWRQQLALAYRRLGRDADATEQRRRAKDIETRLNLLTRLSKEAMAKPWDRDVRLRLADVCEKLDKGKLAKMWAKAAQACPAPRPIQGSEGN
jgi:Flp pilus assembly protein TadD